jgi:phosphomannomutase/phosphoglucomutase
MSPFLELRVSLKSSAAALELNPLVTSAGFREDDARWWFGHPGSEKPPEMNLFRGVGGGNGHGLAR